MSKIANYSKTKYTITTVLIHQHKLVTCNIVENKKMSKTTKK